MAASTLEDVVSCLEHVGVHERRVRRSVVTAPEQDLPNVDTAGEDRDERGMAPRFAPPCSVARTPCSEGISEPFPLPDLFR